MVQSPIVLSLTWAEVEHFRGSSALQIFGKGGVCFFFFFENGNLRVVVEKVPKGLSSPGNIFSSA